MIVNFEIQSRKVIKFFAFTFISIYNLGLYHFELILSFPRNFFGMFWILKSSFKCEITLFVEDVLKEQAYISKIFLL